MKRIITETQALLDLRTLANEIFPLLHDKVVSAGEGQQNARQARELAETAWQKLRQCGPVTDGFTGYFRALDKATIEVLYYTEQHGAAPARVINALSPGAWSLWLCLQHAVYCPEAAYAHVKALCQAIPAPSFEAAEHRWATAEQQLRAEGLLPVRVLAPPSNAGGARYVFEVLVGHEFVPALREALAYWDGYIIAHRPDINHLGQVLPASYYTLSVQSVDDAWPIGKLMVLQYYADRAEQTQAATSRG